MRRFLTALVAAVGMGLFIGGTFALLSGLNMRPQDFVDARGLGPFNGHWSPHDLRFLGAILAGVGGFLFTLGILIRKP